MSTIAIERAEQLKAEHRAKEAAKRAEELRIEAEEKAASDAAFKQAVAEMLKKRDVEWLAEYGMEVETKDSYERVMAYTLPGHAAIFVKFRQSGGWFEASVICNGVWPWYTGSDNPDRCPGYLTLAEALCKAEGNEPIPF